MQQKILDWGIALLALAIGLAALIGVLLFAWHVEEATPWAGMMAGDWGVWVGSIGTIFAFGGTIWLATNERRIRKREERDLALVTIAGFTMRFSEIEINLRIVKERLQQDTAMRSVSNYAGILDMIMKLPTWKPTDLAPLVCLERHIAARVAFTGAHIESIRTSFEDAVKTPTWNATAVGSAEFNKIAIPRLEATSQQLRDIVADAMMFLHSSDLSRSMIPRTAAPINFSGTLKTP